MSQPLRRYLLTAAVALVVFVLGYRHGSYGGLQRAEAAAVALLAALAVCLAGARLARPGPFLLLGGLLAGLTAWTALSLAWAPSADDAFPQLILLGAYVGVFTCVTLLSRRRALSIWCDGIALGIAGVGVVALLSRCFPGLFDAGRPNVELLSGSASRLSFPVGYWNGLGILLACGVPLVLRSAIAGRAGPIRQALSVGYLPVVGTVVYLASSRGAVLTAGVAVAVYIVASGSRWPSAAAAAVLGVAGSLAAIAVVTREPDLVDRPLSDAAADAGSWAFAGVVVVCLITGAAFALVERRVLGSWHPSRRVALGAAAVAAVTVLGGLLAVDAPAQFDAFRTSPVSAGSPATLRAHFLSSSSSGRWQLWASAIDEFETAPIGGRGAGSYESWWAEHGTLPVFVRNAHSLYLETLGELGLVGFLFLVAFVVAGTALGASLVSRTGAQFRYQPAAPLAVFAAYAFAAALDWVWQLPAIGLVAIACVGLLAGAAAEDPAPEAARPPLLSPRAVAALTAVVLLPLCVFAALDAVTQLRLGESERAAARGDAGAAISEAQAARALQPWSAAPLLRLALAEERYGSLQVARTAIEEAVRKDASDWRLRLIASRLQAKAGDVEAATRSLDAARRLNPRSPLFTDSR